MQPLDGGDGYGVVGELESPMPTGEFLDMVGERLSLSMLRHSEVASDTVSRVAICTGSGGSLLTAAVASGAEAYVTADLRYNDFFAAQKELTLLDVGHYESEYCVIELIFDILSKKMINFALHKSLRTENPVRYRLF